MSDETTLTDAPNSDPTPPAVTPPAVAQITDTPTAEPEHLIPKSRFDQVNDELKKLKAAQEKAEKERQAAERKSLEEQNQYKELYEKALAGQAAAETRAAAVAHDALRQRIANTAGQPDLWDRLRGETEEELKADMEALLKLIPKPTAPTLNGGAGGGDRGRPTNAPSAAEIREQAARLGVDANLMAQQYGVSLQENR